MSVVSSENPCATDTFRVTTTMLGGYGQLPPRGPDVPHAHPRGAGDVASHAIPRRGPRCGAGRKIEGDGVGGREKLLVAPFRRFESWMRPGGVSLDRTMKRRDEEDPTPISRDVVAAK